jgi:hypothetical protein
MVTMATKPNEPTEPKPTAKGQSKRAERTFDSLVGVASKVRDASTLKLLLDQNRTALTVETSKTRRGPQPIPNVPDLASRAGLSPAEGTAFRLGAAGEKLTMQSYGYGTGVVQTFVARSYESDICAARRICVEHPEARDPEVIVQDYRESFGFMGLDWVNRRIIEERQSGDLEPLVKEIDDKLRTYPTIEPALRDFPLRATTEEELPQRLRRGKICETLAAELQRIKFLYQGGRSMLEIRSDCPWFQIWTVQEQLLEDDRDAFNRPAGWGSGYENFLLGKYFGKSAHTINDWRKDYRAYMRERKSS